MFLHLNLLLKFNLKKSDFFRGARFNFKSKGRKKANHGAKYFACWILVFLLSSRLLSMTTNFDEWRQKLITRSLFLELYFSDAPSLFISNSLHLLQLHCYPPFGNLSFTRMYPLKNLIRFWSFAFLNHRIPNRQIYNSPKSVKILHFWSHKHFYSAHSTLAYQLSQLSIGLLRYFRSFLKSFNFLSPVYFLF